MLHVHCSKALKYHHHWIKKKKKTAVLADAAVGVKEPCMTPFCKRNKLLWYFDNFFWHESKVTIRKMKVFQRTESKKHGDNKSIFCQSYFSKLHFDCFLWVPALCTTFLNQGPMEPYSVPPDTVKSSLSSSSRVNTVVWENCWINEWGCSIQMAELLKSPITPLPGTFKPKILTRSL